MAGYAIGSLALIILLSALNGFEESIFGDYQGSSPDLKILPIKGKTFEPNNNVLKTLNQKNGVASFSRNAAPHASREVECWR